MAARVSERQLEVLRILDRIGGTDAWGEIWSHYSWPSDDSISPLAMKNFDRVTDALKRKGLISVERDPYTYIDLTDAGRAVVEAHRNA